MDGPENQMLGPNASRNILTPLHGSGLIASHYLLPIGSFSFQIELELADPEFVCVRGVGGALSNSYELTQCRILGDALSADSAIQNQLSSALLEGKALALHFKTWSNTYHSIDSTGGSWAVNLSRGFSRLSSVFVTFSNNALTRTSDQWTVVSAHVCGHGRPSLAVRADTPYVFAGDNFKAQLAIGAHLWPDYPISSTAESYYRLSETLAHASSMDGLTIIPTDYRPVSFIMAWQLERAGGGPGGGMASFSGINTKANNDLIRFTYDGVNALNGNWEVDRQWVHCHYDVIVELRVSGVVLLD